MSNIFEFNGYKPVIDRSAFVHPNATVTGHVIIGKNVYIGPGAAIRGDWGQIIIEDGCNVQENCTIHMFPGTTVLLKASAHVGHGAIIHGATLGRNCLIGMNSVIMDNAVIGDECIVGALTMVPADMVIENRSLVVGNPGGQRRDDRLEDQRDPALSAPAFRMPRHSETLRAPEKGSGLQAGSAERIYHLAEREEKEVSAVISGRAPGGISHFQNSFFFR
jgi:carbonic anhydrase/acetyltransferase-like protein (isoleucine patch superfamily)